MPLARQGFERHLEIGRDGRGDDRAGGRCGSEPLGHMGGEQGEGFTSLRGVFHHSGLCLIGVDDPRAGQSRNDAVACCPGDLRIAVRTAALGRLWQGHEEGRFGGGQAGGLLAEIGEAGGTQSLDIAAIGGKGEIEVEDLLLAETLFDLQRADHLGKLVGEAAARPWLEQARDLHGER